MRNKACDLNCLGREKEPVDLTLFSHLPLPLRHNFDLSEK